MAYTRRKFLKDASAAAIIANLPRSLFACNGSGGSNLKHFGLQLYTLRDVLPQDPKGVLKQVAGMGYTQIESYEGKDGIFWGMTNLEFKKLMDDLGMKIVSSHTNIKQDFERKAGEAAAIGMKYLIDPWEGPQKAIDDFKRIADTFNECGRICKKNGIRFAYHNHDYSFVPVEGQLPQEVMMENTDPDLVDFEMDIYWVVTGGQDPEAWFKKYPGRFKLCHVKDREKDTPLSKKDATCVLGHGSIDYPKILKTASKEGMEYYIVEQEQYGNMWSTEAARLDAAYMKNLKI